MRTTNADMIRDYISDLFSDFLYYDRKEDEDFTLEIAEKIELHITKEEMVAAFMKEINNIYGE